MRVTQWLPDNNTLILVNIIWYLLLALLFGTEGNAGKTIYWIGAAVLSLGVYIMR